MTAKDVIKHTIDFCHHVLKEYVKDLSDADLLVRPVPNANHIAWQLGHLIAGERMMIAALGHQMPELPAGFREFYENKDSAKSDDPKKFLSKKDYLDLLGRVRAGTLAALAATPETDFDKPGPEAMRTYAPTVGAVLHLIGTHQLMHAGQWTIVRRKLNKPVLF